MHIALMGGLFIAVVVAAITARISLGEGEDLFKALGKLTTPIDGPDPRDGIRGTPLPAEQGGTRYTTPIQNDAGRYNTVSTPIQEQDPRDLIVQTSVETLNPHRLTAEDRDAIVRAGQRAFGPSMSEQEIIDHIDDGVLRVARDPSGKIVGFATTVPGLNPNDAMNTGEFQQPTGRTMYLKAIAVDASAHGQGVAQALIQDILKDFHAQGCDTLSVRTQNQKVLDLIAHGLENLKSQGLIRDFGIQEQRFFPGLYGRQLAESTPYPVPGLNVGRGDAVGVVFGVRR